MSSKELNRDWKGGDSRMEGRAKLNCGEVSGEAGKLAYARAEEIICDLILS